MEGIEIEVMWHTDESQAKENMGIDFDPGECTTRKLTFYSVDVIGAKIWCEKDYCNIYAGGQVWIIPKPYAEVKKIIDLWQSKK